MDVPTDVDEIDDILTGEDSDGIAEDGSTSTILGYSQTLTLVGTGATATSEI